MTNALKDILDRNARALELRPSIGQGTARTTARLAEGLRCEVREGPWTLTVDMGEKSGGSGSGPNPGVLGRASLASCPSARRPGRMQSAGFCGVVTERLTVALEYASAGDAIGAAFAGGPVALAYSRFDAPTRDSAHAGYLETIAPYSHREGYRIPGEFVVAVGRKAI
jgi:hypothetical protein